MGKVASSKSINQSWRWDWSAKTLAYTVGVPIAVLALGITFVSGGNPVGWVLVVIGLVWSVIATYHSRNLAEVVIVALLVVASGVTAYTSFYGSSTSPSITHTETTTFDPGNGILSVGVSGVGTTNGAVLSAACDDHYTLVDQGRPLRYPEARHCVAGGQSYDPCFASGRSTLLCVAGPWGKAVGDTVKTPTNAVVNADRVLETPRLLRSRGGNWLRPWALELEGSRRCVLRAPKARPGQPKYVCYQTPKGEWFDPSSNPPVGWVIAFPNELSDPWTVPYLKTDHTLKPITLTVAHAWR